MNAPVRKPAAEARRWQSLLFSVLALGLLQACGQLYGPFPPGTTIFVDKDNTTGIEDGTQANPFNTIEEGVAAATSGATVGVASGTYDEWELDLDIPMQLLGFAAPNTIIDASNSLPGEGIVITIGSPNVRVSGFTQVGRPEGYYGTIGIELETLDANSVRIDHNVITANSIGINANIGITGPGPIGPMIDSNIITGNLAGIWGNSSDRIVNNVIAENQGIGIDYFGDYLHTTPQNEIPHIVNNTIINNAGDGIKFLVFGDPSSAVIKNNIIVGNGGYGLYFGSITQLRPQVTFNLFHNNANGQYSDESVLNTSWEINALPNAADNLVGPPQFADPAVQDYHLTGGSTFAIDRGTESGAPLVDFDGNPRPRDGDGNCESSPDIGAFEAASLYPNPLFAGRCRDYVFNPDKWIFVGCEVIDCCPFCPGENILDWVIRFAGDPVTEIVLRFDNVSPELLRGLTVEGPASWLTADRLLLLGGQEVTLKGLPDNLSLGLPSAERPRATVETIALESAQAGALENPSRTRQAQDVEVTVQQSVRGRTIAEKTIAYELPQSGT